MLSPITILVLSVCAAATAIACIVADERGLRALVYVRKPLTMPWILALAAFAVPETTGLYRNLILLGLVFSLAGDIFPMLPSDRFGGGFRHAQTLVLGTYFSAQWLIALLVGSGAVLCASGGA